MVSTSSLVLQTSMAQTAVKGGKHNVPRLPSDISLEIDLLHSQWACLCANSMYIERTNNCTVASCNATDQSGMRTSQYCGSPYLLAMTSSFSDTFSAVAEICAILGVPVTIGPEATADISTSYPLLSTIAIPTQSSLPPVNTVTSASEYVPGSSSHASTSMTSTSSPGSLASTSATSRISTSILASGSATGSTPTSNESSRSISLSIMTLVLGVGLACIVNMTSVQ